ncbi:MAG: hypothetical protein MK209_05230, partial [Planctomycetes bacterium]|nr:hypothetical protein [Planctomycetota bacterium]
MILTGLLLAVAAQQDASFARFRIDPPGEIVDTIVKDADADGRMEFWFATVEDGGRRLSSFVQQGDAGFSTEATHSQ